MIIDQLFGKPFRRMYAVLAVYLVLAILVFHNTVGSTVLLGLTGVGILAVSIYKLEWGLTAAVLELFGNSHGHLVDASVGGFPLSLRMVVFMAVMMGWGIGMVRKTCRLSLRDNRLLPFAILGVAVAIGFIQGVTNHAASVAFSDGNAYLYLAYALPFASVAWNQSSKRVLLQAFMAGAAWMATMTLGLLYIFTHFPTWMLGKVYTFVRDTRTGELTDMGGNLFRIFLQGQFSVAVAALVTWVVRVWRGNEATRAERRVTLAALTVAAATLIIGLSRSFWVGLVPAALVMCGIWMYLQRPSLKRIGASVSLSVAAGILGLIGIVVIILFPLPYRTGSIAAFSSVFGNRTTDIGDVAISSRWNLLPELMTEIGEAPIFGKGFGEEVAFITDDPRVREIYPDGKWRTYALEWGWLELWLKMGIFGPIAAAAACLLLAKAAWDRVREPEGWLVTAWIGAIVFLVATHVFSPYFNHPLGLGLLMFLIPFLPQKSNTPAQADVVETERVMMAQASIAVPMSE